MILTHFLNTLNTYTHYIKWYNFLITHINNNKILLIFTVNIKLIVRIMLKSYNRQEFYEICLH